MRPLRLSVLLILASLIISLGPGSALSQSRPQRPDVPKGEGKKNQRPTPKTEEELKREADERKRLEEEKNAPLEPGIEKVVLDIVNVDAVVYDKRSGQVITGLKKENFAIFEDGVKQNISNFSTPESPITVTLLLEYSKWTELFGSASGRGFEPGTYEVIRPVAQFLTRFIRPPDDYASVVAFDLRPTPITDFTNDPARIRQTIDILLRNNPAYRENNLFDSLKFTLVGGKGDSEVLGKDYDKGIKAEYSGMVAVKAKRRAIILVASGINTFSSIGLDDVIKLIRQSGIPIYVISTGNMFYKRFESYLRPEGDIITGLPGRLDFLQAANQLKAFAKDSGGAFFEMTFPSEVGSYVNSINALLRNQYSLAYDLDTPHGAGKKYKIAVKVDVNGDGIYDEKQYVIQHRAFYQTPPEPKKKS